MAKPLILEKKVCANCKVEFEAPKYERRKFCSKKCCITSHNKRVRLRKHKKNCAFCNKEYYGHSDKSKYCSSECAAKAYSKNNYESVTTDGTRESKSVKPFILREQDYKCAVCGEPDQWQGKKLVLILDHINGNSGNNKRENLRLVCPNCDSQLPTFKSKNNGNGRHFRKRRRDQGKSF